MVKIDDATVLGGRLELTDLPFLDGQRVRIVIETADDRATSGKSIEEVRHLLKGAVTQFDDPLEPMIPLEDWKSLQ